MHLGSFLGSVPAITKRFAIEDIRPGDAFIGNDAYEGGGTHLPDFVVTEPVFHDGRIVAWAINTAHHSDFADRGHAHIYQEGLRIPPVRLYREGVLQKDIQELILLNCQVPHERRSDLRAQMSANRLGVQRVQALCQKYGAAKVLAAGDALQDYAERKMRAGIAAIPDGTYSMTDYFDSVQLVGELELSVSITVRGDEMVLDFNAPPQMRNGLNVIYTALLASVYYAVKSVIDPTILPNAGLARPITVNAPLGSLLNCGAGEAAVLSDRSKRYEVGYIARVPLADGTLVATAEMPEDDLIPSLLAASDVLGTGWYAADAARVQPGSTVVVVGDGAVGLMGVLAARQMGAGRIIAMSRHKSRQDLALDYGATDIVSERSDAGIARIKEMTNRIGADSVLECVGTQESMLQALHVARPGSMIGYVGVPHGVQFDGQKLFSTQVGMLGGPAPVRRFLPHLMDLVLTRKINPGKVFDLTLPLADVAEGYRAMDERRAIKTLLRV